ncbi:hypothetical protein HCH54_005257 [Aspergillus fumigatus]
MNIGSRAASRLLLAPQRVTSYNVPKPDILVPGVWGSYRDTIIPGDGRRRTATGQLLHHVLGTHLAAGQAKELSLLPKPDTSTFIYERL